MSALSLYRWGRRCHDRGWTLPARVAQRLILLLHSTSLPVTAEIGEGSELAYGGIGVVIHPRARIGERVFISQQVTIGGRSGHYDVPIVGNDCFLGPGAKILGPIAIGEGAVIGANAVVIHDVPSRSVAAGVPARIVRHGIRTEDYYRRAAGPDRGGPRRAGAGGR